MGFGGATGSNAFGVAEQGFSYSERIGIEWHPLTDRLSLLFCIFVEVSNPESVTDGHLPNEGVLSRSKATSLQCLHCKTSVTKMTNADVMRMLTPMERYGEAR